ncbi:MAG: hypothetical protein WCS67_03775 [Bacteroidales bacterium]
MRHFLTTIVLVTLVLASCSVQREAWNVKTTFQTGAQWRPTIDIRADAVMVYGVNGNPTNKHWDIPFEERLKSWRDKGYATHYMTGIAWGQYKDYFTGEWDGKSHLDEGQVQASGDTIWHGHLVPYIVPTDNYLNYFKEKHIKRVIDAGVDHIFLEEPEFWARAGYSDAFKREWAAYYGFPWRPQHESAENLFLSGKLKYHLYYKALDEAFTYAKDYGKSKGMDVKCYVPTHSLLNYSQWSIVSPEASLASLPCVDGYIAQVWTGTSREKNFFNGIKKERVFENSYLEYGCMASMTAPTGRDVFFLTDPIEDRPRDWKDYKKNYQATFTAQLLYPEIDSYEVMPWPERIYEGYYKESPDGDKKIRIPKDYSAMMQIMINSLNDIPKSGNKLSGSQGVSVLMANSLMFQRGEVEGYSDPQLSDFYGLAMPFVKRGVPVGIVHLENTGYKAALADTKVLLMTYSNMKPMDAECHIDLSRWVKEGGSLIYCSTDEDPFQNVKEWWNEGEYSFSRPSDHLFSLLGVPAGAESGLYQCGDGKLWVIRQDPKDFVMNAGGDKVLVEAVSSLYGDALEFKNSFRLERGPYLLVAAIDESVSSEPVEVSGMLIDLFDPDIPVYSKKVIPEGAQGYFYDISKADGGKAKVLAGSSRVYGESLKRSRYSFLSKSPENTLNVSRILLPAEPESVTVDGRETFSKENWDAGSKTYLLRFDNSPDGVGVTIKW